MEIFKIYSLLLRFCLLQELSLAVALLAAVADLAPTVVVALDLGDMLALICGSQILRVCAGLRAKTHALLEAGLPVLGRRAAGTLCRSLLLRRFLCTLLRGLLCRFLGVCLLGACLLFRSLSFAADSWAIFR